MAVRNLDEISEDSVVADLEGIDSRSRALFHLYAGDAVLASVAQRAPFVELGVDSHPDARLIPERYRRSLHEDSDDVVTEIRASVPLAHEG